MTIIKYYQIIRNDIIINIKRNSLYRLTVYKLFVLNMNT